MSNPIIRDVVTLLGHVEAGRAVRESNAAFRELMEELHAHSEAAPKAKVKGKLTIEIGLTLVNGTAEVAVKTTAKAPPKDGHQAMYFMTSDGRISTQHPHQLDIMDVIDGGRDGPDRDGAEDIEDVG